MHERKYYSQEAKVQARREKILQTSLALSIGIGLGTVLALLFAPESGEQIRENVAHTVEDRVSEVEKQLKELRHRFGDRLPDLT